MSSNIDFVPADCRSEKAQLQVLMHSSLPASLSPGAVYQCLAARTSSFCDFFLRCPKNFWDANNPAAGNYIFICFEPCFIFMPPIPRPLRTSGVISAYCIMAPPCAWLNFIAAPLSANGISSLPMGPIMSLPTT